MLMITARIVGLAGIALLFIIFILFSLVAASINRRARKEQEYLEEQERANLDWVEEKTYH